MFLRNQKVWICRIPRRAVLALTDGTHGSTRKIKEMLKIVCVASEAQTINSHRYVSIGYISNSYYEFHSIPVETKKRKEETKESEKYVYYIKGGKKKTIIYIHRYVVRQELIEVDDIARSSVLLPSCRIFLPTSRLISPHHPEGTIRAG